MRPALLFACCLCLTLQLAADAPAGDWPAWRGRHGTGITEGNQNPPIEWNSKKNIVWKTPIPGRGHSSPTIVAGRIYLGTADEKKQIQYVLAFDQKTGKQLWQTELHRKGFDPKGHKKKSYASSTVACDGERLFINLVHKGGAWTSCLDLEGKILWQTRISGFVTHQGYGSSPILFKDMILVSTDNKKGGRVAGVDRQSGKIVWFRERPAKANYTSPAVLMIDGKPQLVLAGCDKISSYDPSNGKTLWEIDGSTTECVGSALTDGKLILASGGWPKKHTMAVRADGSGEVVWENTVQTYVPTMLVVGEFLYTVTDDGVGMCWKTSTGKLQWKARVGGTFHVSLVLVGNHIYTTNLSGTTYIFEATPEKYVPIGENRLGTDVYATPTFCDSRIYYRAVDDEQPGRQEVLYCLGVLSSAEGR